MNRRSFFKLMGLGGVATAAAVALPSLLTPKTTSYRTYIMGSDALTVADVRRCVEQMKSAAVKPKNGQFYGWVHPSSIKYTFQAAPPVRGQRLRFIDC